VKDLFFCSAYFIANELIFTEEKQKKFSKKIIEILYGEKKLIFQAILY
jgi:hypothetical protein